MKQYLPYNVLMLVAVVFISLMVVYNLVLRENFAITVSYTMPAIPKPQVAEDVAKIKKDSAPKLERAAQEAYFQEQPDEDAITSVTFPLDLNLATEEQLRFIPQVGNVMSQRIVQYRDVLGGYTDLEQLKEIKGVGDSTFEKLAPYLIIEENE